MTWSDARKNAKPGLGVKAGRERENCKLASVYEGGVAHRAGLSAGDVLVAIDRLRVTAGNLDKLLGRYRTGDNVEIMAFRRDELMHFTAVLAPDEAPQVSLNVEPKPTAAARLRAAWLGTGSVEKTR